MRALLFAGSLGLIAAALALVPLPLFELSPASAREIGSTIELSRSSDEVSGQFLLTAVEIEHPTLLELVGSIVDGDEDVVFRNAIIPADVDTDEYRRLQRRIFDESARVAAAVAQQAVGLDATVSGGGAVVFGVLSGSPADGELEAGDVIVEVDGRQIDLASDVGAALGGFESGEQVQVRVEREDERRTVELTLESLEELDQPGLGVALRTLDRDISLPVDVTTEGDIGGPSAGLVFALHIYDRLEPSDVSRGRRIAGTGTIAPDGTVGPVGGVTQKVAAAESANADLFLVPEGNADEARSAAGDVDIVPVGTFQQALDALAST